MLGRLTHGWSPQWWQRPLPASVNWFHHHNDDYHHHPNHHLSPSFAHVSFEVYHHFILNMIRYTLMTLAPRPTLPPGYSRFAIGSSPSSSPMPLAFKYICLSFISATCGNTWEFYYICSFRSSFLSVQTGSEDSSKGDPVIHLLSEWVTFWFWNTQQDPSHLWPLRHILGVMKKHDRTNKKTTTNTKTMTMTSTFREHLQRAIFVTCDICSDCMIRKHDQTKKIQ